MAFRGKPAPAPTPAARGAPPPAARGGPPPPVRAVSSTPPVAGRGAPAPGGGGAPPAVSPRGGVPPPVSPRTGGPPPPAARGGPPPAVPAAGRGGAPPPAPARTTPPPAGGGGGGGGGRDEVNAAINARRAGLIKDEGDEGDEEWTDDLSKKEDKTTLSHNRLKDDDKKSEKLGSTVFAHAKKFKTLEGDETKLRDESEWDDTGFDD